MPSILDAIALTVNQQQYMRDLLFKQAENRKRLYPKPPKPSKKEKNRAKNKAARKARRRNKL